MTMYTYRCSACGAVAYDIHTHRMVGCERAAAIAAKYRIEEDCPEYCRHDDGPCADARAAIAKAEQDAEASWERAMENRPEAYDPNDPATY